MFGVVQFLTVGQTGEGIACNFFGAFIEPVSDWPDKPVKGQIAMAVYY